MRTFLTKLFATLVFMALVSSAGSAQEKKSPSHAPDVLTIRSKVIYVAQDSLVMVDIVSGPKNKVASAYLRVTLLNNVSAIKAGTARLMLFCVYHDKPDSDDECPNITDKAAAKFYEGFGPSVGITVEQIGLDLLKKNFEVIANELGKQGIRVKLGQF